MLWLSFHPVHVTLTSIDYDGKEGNFKGFVRVYLDDLLLDCELHGFEIEQDKLIAGNAESVATLEQYINDRIRLEVNERAVAGKITDVRISDLEVDMDLVFSKSGRPGVLTVTNRIMTELYSDQANMIIVKVNDFEQGVKLTPEMTEQTFKLN